MDRALFEIVGYGVLGVAILIAAASLVARLWVWWWPDQP